jgi:hypothetical protein
MAIPKSLVKPVPLLRQSALLASLEGPVSTMKPAVAICGMSE